MSQWMCTRYTVLTVFIYIQNLDLDYLELVTEHLFYSFIVLQIQLATINSPLWSTKVLHFCNKWDFLSLVQKVVTQMANLVLKQCGWGSRVGGETEGTLEWSGKVSESEKNRWGKNMKEWGRERGRFKCNAN